MPAGFAAATQPPQPDKAGLTLTWKLRSGQDYTILVEADALVEDASGWAFTTTDGRKVTVFRAHAMVFESRSVTIKGRKLPSDG
jgi:hypothetical protein